MFQDENLPVALDCHAPIPARKDIPMVRISRYLRCHLPSAPLW